DLYDVTRIYTQLYSHSSSPFRVWGSVDGINRITLYDSDRIPGGANVWSSIPIDLEEAKGIRYLIFGVVHAEINLNGLAIYGKKKNAVPLVGFKSDRNVPVRTFNDTIGTNAFLQEQNFDM